MAEELVKARITAVKEIAHGLGTYNRGLQSAVASARSDLNAVTAEFQLAVVGSQRRLQAAQNSTRAAAAALAACRENCGSQQQALSRARVQEDLADREHQSNKQAQSAYERVARDLLATLRTVTANAAQQVPSARQNVLEYAETLTAYLRSGTAG